MILLLVLCLGLTLLPALMVIRNQSLFAMPRDDGALPASEIKPQLSVLIPARNEAESISASLSCALNSRGVDLEVVVLDDESEDATADIVLAVSQRDTRVRLIRSKTLPSGWNGKQHACEQLAAAAKYDNFVFLDADVRLSEDALSTLLRVRDSTGVELLSAFPYQETETPLEKLIIPLMHYVLLGYLPLERMRASTSPAFAAGCGQLFLTDRESYTRAGTHEAIAASRHDGIQLPRAYRSADLKTDVRDGTAIASCRMYHSAAEVIRGVLKNADEGIANLRLIVPFSVLLLGAGLAPWILLVVSWIGDSNLDMWLAFSACVLSLVPRLLCARAYAQSWLGAVLHPLGIALFVLLQWVALIQNMLGKRVAWRGRVAS